VPVISVGVLVRRGSRFKWIRDRHVDDRLRSYRHPVVTDKEAEDIRKKLEEGWRGPVLLTWLYRLLEDREERVSRERDWESKPPRNL
jgi:hypothetical protein